MFDESHQTALPLLSIAYIRLAQGEAAAAQRSASDALLRLERALAESHLVGIAQCLLGLAQQQQGDASGVELVAAARKLMAQGAVPAPYAELCGIAPS